MFSDNVDSTYLLLVLVLAAGSEGVLGGPRQPPAHPGGEGGHVQDGLTERQERGGELQSQEIRSRFEGG